jgi:hypothetical protein
MLTYQELIALRDKLANGEVTVASAKAQYWNDYKEGQRSWETKDWKDRRATVIKDKCEICTSTDTLTLQHGSHPKRYAEFERELTRAYTTEYNQANPEVAKDDLHSYILQHYEYVPVPLCPECKSSSLSIRKRKVPKYLCTACRLEFDEAMHKTIDELIAIFYVEDTWEVREKCFISKDQWKNKHNLPNIKYWLQRNRAKTKDALAIEREAFLLYLNDCIQYLSFEDTITACKKCAYNLDIKKMDLCPACQQHYKGIQYPTCIPCLPEDKRKAALEMIEFGKGWQAMHEDLGID